MYLSGGIIYKEFLPEKKSPALKCGEGKSGTFLLSSEKK